MTDCFHFTLDFIMDDNQYYKVLCDGKVYLFVPGERLEWNEKMGTPSTAASRPSRWRANRTTRHPLRLRRAHDHHRHSQYSTHLCIGTEF